MALMEIGFELTNDCNLDCLHCLREKDDMESYLPIPLIRKILKEARVFGPQRIGFTGGEPTLHPDFLGAVDAVTDLGYPYFFITNGLNYQGIFPQICGGKNLRRRSLLLGVSLSLDGAQEDTHDGIRGRGSFRRAIQAAMYLREKKVPLTIQMVVNKKNKGELEGMAALAHDLGARRLFYAALFPTPQVLDHGIIPSPEESKELFGKILKLKEQMKMEIYHSLGWYEPLSFFQCRFIQMEQINIDYRGRLTFCCNLSGYRGTDGADHDVIADLRTTRFHRALRLLYGKISEVNTTKLFRIGEGQMTDLDHFPCHHCLHRFGKLEWMRRSHPESPWTKGPDGKG